MKFDKKEIFTIPNILTYIRILCVPFFIWFFLDESIAHNTYIAFGIFIFASVTDLVDGFIARHFHLVSDIGKVADPIADKLLLVSTLVCMTVTGKIHWGYPLVFCIKETYMVLGGSVIVKIFKSEYVLQSNIFGKAATCLNSLGIVLAFFVNEVSRGYDVAVNVILIFGAVFAVVTAAIYTIQFFKFRKTEVRRKAIAAVSSADNMKTQENVVDAQIEEKEAARSNNNNIIIDEDTKEDAEKFDDEQVSVQVEASQNLSASIEQESLEVASESNVEPQDTAEESKE